MGALFEFLTNTIQYSSSIRLGRKGHLSRFRLDYLAIPAARRAATAAGLGVSARAAAEAVAQEA